MRAELHADVREELSARLDGEVDATTSERLDAHLAGCDDCRRYEEALRGVKRAVALQPAPQSRDLAPAITARISRDVSGRRRERRSLIRTGLAAAAVTAIVLAGSIPWRTDRGDVAVASEITRAIQSAATDVTSYHARFDITERGWHDAVPERHFVAEIWFRAPERLRMEIRDLTPYPGEGWPTNDTTLVAGPREWWLRETASCPAPALPGCAVAPAPEIRALRNRQPFDGSTVLPTDLILPLETLADTDGLTVTGREIVRGRDAHHVVLQRWQAMPLIDSLQVAGTWRHFSPTARVDLWLDSATWFPLRFSVGGDDRSLVVTTTSFEQPENISDDTFAVPDADEARDGGFRPIDPGPHPSPSYLAGLEPYRTGSTVQGQTIDSYVDGMTWMKVISDSATEPTLATFTDEVVDLGHGRSAYFEPSSDALRRAVEILGPDERVRIESNLPRRELVRVAASVPVDGRAFRRLETPTGSIERIDQGEVATFSYSSEPTWLPEGFRFSSAFVDRSDHDEQLTIYYRRISTGAPMGEIRVTQASGVTLLPPSSENLLSVAAGDLRARWSPLRSELEWIDGDVYRAVAVPGFDLSTAIRIARSIGS